MTDIVTAPPYPSTDKREAILGSALRLIAHLGLHNAPMSALAREAGVAAGTLHLYFPSKEAMINALYLDVLEDRDRALLGDAGSRKRPLKEPRVALWETWHAVAGRRADTLTPAAHTAARTLTCRGLAMTRSEFSALLTQRCTGDRWCIPRSPTWKCVSSARSSRRRSRRRTPTHSR